MQDIEDNGEVYSVIKFYNEEENPMYFFNEFVDDNYIVIRDDYIPPYQETIMFTVYKKMSPSSHIQFMHRLNIEEFCDTYNMNLEQTMGVHSGVIEDDFYKFVVINSRCPIVEG